MSARKRPSTRERLLQLVANRPGLTISEYARILGRSKARVHQLLTKLGARHVWVAKKAGEPPRA
jgi:predicted ArsR family transcriptional regulator